MSPCLTLSNIRYESRVKWSHLGKGIRPSPTPQCYSYWKRSLLVPLNYSRQLYLHIRGGFNKFTDFFLYRHLKLLYSWKFSILLLYILWDDWPIFMISGLNEQLQQELECTQLKPDCQSWWISKMQSGREEERYAIKLYCKLGKNAMRWTLDLLLWPRDQETEFLVEACSLSQTQEGQTEKIHPQIFDDPFFWQHWHNLHALGSHWTDSQQEILCWGFKGVQEEIPSEEVSTVKIGSVAFPPGQCTSPQLHPCHRLFDQDGHQDSSSASL